MGKILASTAALFFLGALPAAAQNAISTGNIAGSVRDSSVGVVSAADVTVISNETDLSRNGATDSGGLYNFPLIKVGRYTVRVRHDGFKTTEVRNVIVQVGQTTNVDVQLAIGPLTQQLVVEATAPMFRPGESSVTTVVPREFIEDLPLSGRRYTDFVLLAPNVAADGDAGAVSIGGQQGSSGSGYHNGNGANSFTVDGANATSSFFGDARGGTIVPYIFGEQSIQEFQVAVTPYSASYGGAGTGFINTVTKSGGDVFHGDAFYYLRHSATGANDAVDKANGVPKPLNVLQQFGADLGGPLIRHKLWFYFDYEQQRQKDPVSIVDPNVNESLFLNVAPGTPLPAASAPFPVPSTFSRAPMPGDSNYPIYLQQVSDALNAIDSSVGQRERRRDDLVLFSKIDWQPGAGDHFTFIYNYSRFNSPAGLLAYNPVAGTGLSALPNYFVRDHHASINWTHVFRPNLFNDLHVSFLRDDQSTTPSGLIKPNFTSVLLLPIGGFLLGNAPNTPSLTREFQWEFGERLDWTHGRHSFQFGLDLNRTHVTDFSPGFSQGFYGYFSLADFATGAYAFYLQSVGNPVFPLTVPYYGFYAQDKFRARPNLTFDIGIREDFQVFPQPDPNPAFPLAGQYPNQYRRLAPRLGFAYQAFSTTVVRGGIGVFHELLNGVNYVNAVSTNGASTHLTNALSLFDLTQPANHQSPTFPNTLSNVGPVASSNISLFDPDFRTPYVLSANLEIQQSIGANTTLSVGTMWTHGIHLISSSAYDFNLKRPPGTTTYVVCPPGTTTVPCSGRTIVLPNLDAVLLEGQEGAMDPNLGQLNALISPGLNHYNSLYASLQRRVSNGFAALVSYTYSKNIESNGLDFNNQFDLGRRGPSLLDQRHRLSLAAIYQTTLRRGPNLTRALLSDWTLSTVTQFNSGRPYGAELNTSCASSTLSFENCDGLSVFLNDSATLQSTGNTALGTGTSPAAGLHSFRGPWIIELDLGVARTVHLREVHALTFKAQAFNLLNRANFFVQNGAGVNSIQYNPIGKTCGDGTTLNQLCYLVPNPDFGTRQSVSQANGPRIFQFAIQYRF
jgi:Carboxypeptidase regulatory-like domain